LEKIIKEGNMNHKAVFSILILLAPLLVSGCGTHENTQDEDRQELDQLAAQIDGIVGDATCDDISDCRMIEFGTKPCGGPWGYLVYSIKETDTTFLAYKVAKYNGMDDAYNKKWGILSDCVMAPMPKLANHDGHCVGEY